MDGVAIQLGAASFCCGEEIVPCGIEDHAKHAAPAILKSDGDAIGRIAMSKICGAVKRINDPEIGCCGLFNAALFFGEEAMGWEQRMEMVDDALFCCMVCVGDKIDRVLMFDAKPRFDVVKQKRSGLLPCVHSSIQQNIQGNMIGGRGHAGS